LSFLFFAAILFGNDPLKINTALADGTWFNDGSGTAWSNRFKITPASVNSDLYYDLSLAPASFWSNVRSDGGDIRVTAQDGTTQLAREVSGFVKSDVAKVTTSGSGGDFYSPAMPVTAGQNYVLSMDVKWVSGSCPFLGLSYDNGVVDWKIGRISSGAVVDIDRVSTDWQHLEYSFTMPAASNARMSIEAYSGEAKSDSGNTEIHFKNIALTPGAVSSNGSGFAGWTNPGTQGNLFELTQSGAGSLFIGGLAATNNVFLPSDVPSASPTDGPYELGMIFSSDVAGYITKLRYYRQTGDTVSHDGHLWNSIGTLLATAAFPASSNVGWQSVALASPIAITANTNYTVSYSIDAGTPEPRTGSYFTAQKDSGHLHAPINAGVYTVTMGQFPTSSYLSGNYFADVDFSTKAIPDTSFYVYYGNPSATEPAAGSTYGKYNVWESAAKLVAHMEDANDSTVNQNNGTIANAYPVTADAKVNKGYQYNAANYNYITIGDKASLDFTTGFTIGGWIYKSGDFVDGAILGKINAGGPFNGYMLWTGQSVNGVTLYIDQGGRISTGALSDNAWHRIIATWNGAQLNMYADGTPVTPVNYNVAPTSSGKSFIIGGYSYAALNNLLDEAIVYDRPWSAQEVATDYADQNDPASFWTTGNQGLSNDNQTITVSGTVDPVITMNVGALAAGTPCDGTFTGNGGTVALGTLTPGAVASSDANSVAHICVRVSANPYYGLIGLVSSANGALVSTGTPGNIIPSATATLVPGTAGYGACVAAPSGADSGSATWAGDTPYASGSCDSTHHSVGRLQTTAQQFMHANGPVQNLYLTGYVKAAVSGTIAAHNDYADTLSFVVSGTF